MHRNADNDVVAIASSPWRRGRRFIRRAALVLLAVLAAAVVAFVVLMSTGRVHEWIRATAVSQVNGMLAGRLEVDSFSGSLLSGIRANGVRLSLDGAPVFAAESVDLGYSIWPLLRREFVFSSLRVTRPEIWLSEEEGVWNMTRLAREAEQREPSPWRVEFVRLMVGDGVVHVRAEGRDPIDLAPVDLEGRLVLGSEGTEIALQSARLRENRTNEQIDLRGNIALTDVGWSVTDAHLSANGLSLNAEASSQASGLAQLRAALALENWESGRFHPYVPEALAAAGALDGTVAVDGDLAALATTWDLRSQAAGRTSGSGQLDLATADTIGITGSASVAGLDVRTFEPSVPLDRPLSAEATVDLRVSYAQPARPSGTIHVRGGRIVIAGYVLDAFELRGDSDGSRIRVGAQTRAYGASANTSAVVSLGADSVRSASARGTIRDLDLERIPGLPARTQVPTNVSSDYEVQWTPDDWSARLIAREATIAGVAIDADSAVEARGRGNAVAASIDARAAAMPAGVIGIPSTVATSLNGAVQGSAQIADITRAGAVEDLVADVRLSLVDTGADAIDPARAEVSVSLASGIADIAALNVHTPIGDVTAAGRLALVDQAGDVSDLSFAAHLPSLEELATLGVSGVSGAGRAEGRVTGPAGQWRVQADVAAQELAYGDSFKALTVNGDVDVEVPYNPVDAAGRITLDGAFIVVAGNDIPSAVVTVDRRGQRIDVQGRVEQPNRAVTFDTALDFFPDYQQMELRQLEIAGSGEPWRMAGPDAATVRYAASGVSVDGLAMERAAERIEIVGHLPLQAGQRDAPQASASDSNNEQSALIVNLTSVNAGDLSELALGTPRVTGTADGQVTLRGVGDRLAASADVTLVAGTLENVPFNLVALQGEIAEGMADITARVEEPGGAALDITGDMPIREDAGVADIRVAGQGINLGLLGAATTTVTDVTGQATVDVHVTGPLSRLAFDGMARLDNGALTVAPTGVRYQEINAGLRFDNEWVYVDTASLSDTSGGLVTMTGRTGLRATDGVRPIALMIESRQIKALDGPVGQVDLELALRVAGSVSAPQVTGSLRPTRARLELDEILKQIGAPPPLPPTVPDTSSTRPVAAASLESGASAVAVPAGAAVPAGTTSASAANSDAAANSSATSDSNGGDNAAAEANSSTWANADVDIRLSLPDNMVIRARDLRTGAGSMGLGNMNLTVGGEIALRKAPHADPVVAGAVEVVRGFYEFQGRRFEVVRGSAIDFRGNEPSNPSLAVTGEREVSGVTARVAIGGTAQQPTLSLSSQPSLDESDILALIIFNQPINQLGAGERVDLMERAGDIALGAVASTLTDSIGQALDVDLFEIRAPSAERAGEVALGSQVNQRVFVGFRQQFGSNDASRLSIEYRLSEALRLMTTVGQGTREDGGRTDAARLDLVYTIKY